MMFLGKYKLLKSYIAACDYEYILREINEFKKKNIPFLISPLASHTLVRAFFDDKLRNVLDGYDFLVPDGEWVKRALNFLYRIGLKERVYGPELMLRVCELTQNKQYKLFLYGTTEDTLNKLAQKLKKLFPKISIVGFIPSKFAPLTEQEKKELLDLIRSQKTDILFVGLGSPLQETFVYDLFKNENNMRQFTVITVGASFDFIAGVKPQAPKWMQDRGIEWLFRLAHEPRRLWKRYLIYGPLFILLIIAQKIPILLNPPHRKPIKAKLRGCDGYS